MTITLNGQPVRVSRVTFITRNGRPWPVLCLADNRRVTVFQQSKWVELSPKGVSVNNG